MTLIVEGGLEKRNEVKVIAENGEEIKIETPSQRKKRALAKQYIVSDNNLRLLNACIDTNSAALLIGETGTGKTTLIREVANEKGKNLIRISVNGSMGVEEILGKWLVNKGTTVWQDGVLTMAMRQGYWVVMDEINAALPEILFVLHSLLDDDRKIILPEKDNEIVKPHADFRFFATMNPTEEYAGTKDMNKALMSRFTAVLFIDVLDELSELKLLINKGADKDIALKLVKLAKDLRKHKSKDNIFYFCSTRDLVQAVSLMKSGVNISDAVLGSVVNKMSPKEFQIVKPEFDAVLTAEIKLPFASIEELIDSVIRFEDEKLKMKREFDIRLAEEVKKAREGMDKDLSDKVKADLLNRIAEIVKS